MINKIIATNTNSYVHKFSKEIINRRLLKPVAASMSLLAGASMANLGGAHLTATEMVIPDGLDLKERFYYHIKGKLPQSVYDRWFPKTDDVIVGQNDEIVTVNTDGHYIGSIIEGPHEALLAGSSDSFVPSDESVAGNVDDISELVSPDTEAALSTFEIFKHLAGLQ